jgi:hypothetical protein
MAEQGDRLVMPRSPFEKNAPRFAARPDTGLLFDQPIGTGT